MISLSDLIAKRGAICEVCHHSTVYLERHHVFQHRMKGKPELDDERNLELVCPRCHSTVANSYENRCAFWRIQSVRYPDLLAWYSSIPLKCKESFG